MPVEILEAGSLPFRVVSVSVPIKELTHDEYLAVKRLALRKLVEAIVKNGKTPENFIVRDLMPSDVGLPTEKWQFTISAANAWNTVVDSYRIPDDRFIVIYGFAVRNPGTGVTAVYLYNGKTPVALVDIEKALVDVERPIAIINPEVWKEGDLLTIQLYGTKAQTEELVPLGYTAEPIGEKVGSR